MKQDKMKGGKNMVRNKNNTQNREESYVEKAERIIKENKLSEIITTSKIRGLLTQVNELYNDIVLEADEQLDEKYVKAIQHLKVKMVYDAGRDRQLNTSRRDQDTPYRDGRIKYFFEKTGLLEEVSNIGNSREKFLDYCKYFEALVAYHKFYGGKE